jgi:hypothetical protein
MSNTVCRYGTVKCDFCQEEACYDARIPSLGQWGNLCERHFEAFGCKLGTGNGQAFVARFKNLSAVAKVRAVKYIRKKLVKQYGKCQLTDEDIIKEYIIKPNQLFYLSGEVCEEE